MLVVFGERPRPGREKLDYEENSAATGKPRQTIEIVIRCIRSLINFVLLQISYASFYIGCESEDRAKFLFFEGQLSAQCTVYSQIETVAIHPIFHQLFMCEYVGV